MKLRTHAKNSTTDQSQIMEIDPPCEVTVEIGKRLIRFSVDADGGARIEADTGSPEDNEV